MGYDISSRGGYISVHLDFWQKLRLLAEIFAWEPAGTQPATIEGQAWDEDVSGPWGGSYTGNNWQIIAKEDAQAMADALTRALDDIPEEDDDSYVPSPGKLLADAIREGRYEEAGGEVLLKACLDLSDQEDDTGFVDAMRQRRTPTRSQCIEYFSGRENKEFIEKLIEVLEGGSCTIS